MGIIPNKAKINFVFLMPMIMNVKKIEATIKVTVNTAGTALGDGPLVNTCIGPSKTVSAFL